MKELFFTCLICLLIFPYSVNATEETVESKIESVALFKNGLAVVTRTISVSQPGDYIVNSDINPIHGTFWIDSEADIEIQSTKRDIFLGNLPSNKIDFQDTLSGKDVEIYFKDNEILPLKGTVEKVEPLKGEEAWNRDYQRRRGYCNSNLYSTPQTQFFGKYLIIKTSEGLTFVDSSIISYLNVKNPGGLMKEQRPVLLLKVNTLPVKPSIIRISYLTKGLAWAPSYRIDISNPQSLGIEQKVVIKNELEDLVEVDMELISGFPGIKFAHVTSPLSLNTNWNNFFNQLNQRVQPGHAAQANVMGQQAIAINQPTSIEGIDLSAKPSGEGVDLHFQSISHRSLNEGDSLAIRVAKDQADYERIVEWIIPDSRNAEGRYIEDYQRRQNPDKYEDAAWDAIRFKNPFDFPMTTAPAIINSKDHFNGQTLSYWVNSGESTTLHITKALSIRTKSVEHEKEGDRTIVNVGGNKYRKVSIEGKLFVNNHRNEKVSLVIRRRFSGDLLEATDSPKSSLKEEGAYSVNKRNELFWELNLNPGEEKELSYQYAVLVRH